MSSNTDTPNTFKESIHAMYLRGRIENYYDHLQALLTNSKTEKPSDDDLESLYTTGYHLFSTRHYPQARQYFKKICEFSPTNSAYWRALGAIYHQMALYPKAIQSYNTAIELDPNNIINRFFRIEALFLAHKVPRALLDLKSFINTQSFAIFPNEYLNKAKILLEIYSNDNDDSLR